MADVGRPLVCESARTIVVVATACATDQPESAGSSKMAADVCLPVWRTDLSSLHVCSEKPGYSVHTIDRAPVAMAAASSSFDSVCRAA